MEIKDILDMLGLDLTNPEVKRGAVDAIEAILGSRAATNLGGGRGGGSDTEVELDPELIQPSIKQSTPSAYGDIEVEDDEHILDQIRHNKSEEDQDEPSASSSNSSNSGEQGDSTASEEDTEAASEQDSTPEGANENDSEAEIDSQTADSANDGEEDDSDDTSEDSDASDEDSEESISDDVEETDDTDAPDGQADEADSYQDSGEETDSEEASDDEEEMPDFDEADLLDDELAGAFEDSEARAKLEARKIKRERTLAAAKKTLADARTKKTAPALIRELEKAIEALEALTEAVTKNISDISDEEFNMLINRVFDAIDAIGDSDLTYTTDEERELRAQEIKADLGSQQTQTELSAEDAAKIRAEHQAIAAREREAAKYAPRARGSFRGFQEFLTSLYRAIALQVQVEETRDASWSAINHRDRGVAVLQPGKKVQELPNKKIPVIDFYFDQSGSWTESDIEVGKKAVSQLADMEANGQIKINIYYFANNVHTDAASARNEGGTRAWNEIIKNIITTQATNVIIMTDEDMEGWWEGPTALKYTVPGYVWYLWKGGRNAPRLPRDLKGRGGTMQFSFNTN